MLFGETPLFGARRIASCAAWLRASISSWVVQTVRAMSEPSGRSVRQTTFDFGAAVATAEEVAAGAFEAAAPDRGFYIFTGCTGG